MEIAYKIYAMMLEKRLRAEIEKLKILTDTQAGFRKGRTCIDNVFILKVAAEKTKAKDKGRLLVFSQILRQHSTG